MGRALSIWLPRLPLDRLRRLGDPRVDGEFAIAAETGNAWLITHPSAAAEAAGVLAGLSVADARAVCPKLATAPADPARERALLTALARWADRLSPRAALDKPDGLLLDITGCAHLFGGEAAMGRHCRDLLEQLAMASRIGIADTKGAARALARHAADTPAVAAPGGTAEALRGLPLAALDLPPGTVRDLHGVGLKSIGQLYPAGTGELARRFGLETPRALAAALGHAPDPLTPLRPAAVFSASMTLPEPIGLQADVERVLERLAGVVCERLRAAAMGARTFVLTVRRIDADEDALRIGFARPCAAVRPVVEQFAHPLARFRMESGADRFRLTAGQVEPAEARQAVIGRDTGTADGTDGIDGIVSALGNRLGFDRIRRFAPRESHLPEREFTTVEAARADDGGGAWGSAPGDRPLRLFAPPEPVRTLEPGLPPRRFEWRRTVYAAETAKGPERLAPEWWRDSDPRVRDYWRVQTRNGPRLWLMRHPEAEPPDWRVAGRFA